jgi:tRNA 2-selenouridine synthase
VHLRTIDCASALARLAQFDALIDTRSPAEFALDHLPGAINCPALSDAERAQVGTLYQQASPFEARRVGAAHVARNISLHLRSILAQRPRSWTPLVYCWRGGERSASMVHVMARVGWKAHRLEGGYRAFRRAVLDSLATQPALFRYRVLCGATGSGKSRLLDQLRLAGAQVLDLEQLAAHRGSVLGALPGMPQPGQKRFETRLWWALRRLDPSRAVFVESESRKIGDRQLPDAMIESLRGAECVSLDLPLAERIRLLRDEYRHYESTPHRLCEQLDCLTSLHGAAKIARWKQMAHDGHWDGLVAILLEEHYDPVYRRSLGSNYRRSGSGITVSLDSAEPRAFAQAALRLVGEPA